MRRRTFLAAVPAIAVGAALQAQGAGPGKSNGPAPSPEGDLPGFEPAGANRFISRSPCSPASRC
jgi:hypothetical protein